MERIKFHNPMGLVGRFTTVREGMDWMGRVEIGDEVELVSNSGSFLGVAKVADFWVGDLAVVPASLLEIEHDPLARTYSGAVFALRGRYRDREITPESKVTVIVLDFLRSTQLMVPQ